jgi:puromycin-sensitive aminopeptidase
MAGPNWQDLAPTEVVQFEEDEILVIGFQKELPVGEGVLTINFTGTLNDQMRGFYRRYRHLSFRYGQDKILLASL